MLRIQSARGDALIPPIIVVPVAEATTEAVEDEVSGRIGHKLVLIAFRAATAWKRINQILTSARWKVASYKAISFRFL